MRLPFHLHMDMAFHHITGAVVPMLCCIATEADSSHSCPDLSCTLTGFVLVQNCVSGPAIGVADDAT